MGTYQVSHLPITHTGLRLAVVEMIDNDVRSSFRAISERINMINGPRFPEWYLRRVIEGNAVKRVCFMTALTAQGR